MSAAEPRIAVDLPIPAPISELPFAEYLKLPAIGQGVIQATVERCPYAGYWESYLNDQREDDANGASDIGTVAHEILLEGSEACVEVIDPRDYPAEKTGNIPDGWTNKAIRLARDNARRLGKIPILEPAMQPIRQMVAMGRLFLESLRVSEPAIWGAFQDSGGESEVTLLWREGETLCRARPDRLARNRSLVVHVKTTQGTAAPEAWGRSHLVGDGHYITAAWYRRAVAAAFGVEDSAQVFLVGEQKPPYLWSLVGVDPAGFELGEQKVAAGLEIWQRCAARKYWPAYPNRVAYYELPSWERVEWEAREISLTERLLLGSQA